MNASRINFDVLRHLRVDVARRVANGMPEEDRLARIDAELERRGAR